jgi:hypothetical protein
MLLEIPTVEEGMVKYAQMGVGTQLGEAIEVELPQEGGVVAMSEVFRKDSIAECNSMAYDKGPLVLIPIDEFSILAIFEHLMQFGDKGRGLDDALSSSLLHCGFD